MRLRERRVRAVLIGHRLRPAAGDEDGGDCRRDDGTRASHGRAPARHRQKAIPVAAITSAVATSERISPPGIAAQASRACMNALKSPKIQAASSVTA